MFDSKQRSVWSTNTQRVYGAVTGNALCVPSFQLGSHCAFQFSSHLITCTITSELQHDVQITHSNA